MTELSEGVGTVRSRANTKLSLPEPPPAVLRLNRRGVDIDGVSASIAVDDRAGDGLTTGDVDEISTIFGGICLIGTINGAGGNTYSGVDIKRVSSTTAVNLRARKCAAGDVERVSVLTTKDG